MNKAILSAVAILLVAAVVIAVVSGINRTISKDQPNTPQQKFVTSICQPTDYRETCEKTLSGVNGTDPKKYIEAAILATMEAVKKQFNLSESLVVNATNNDPRSKMALEDCQDLMSLALDQLEVVINTVNDNGVASIGNLTYDLQNWLSSVIAYQESCLDQFDEESALKSPIKDGMVDAEQLTSNALAIISELSSFLANFNLKINIPGLESPSRRLLGEDGLPTWLEGEERRMLAARKINVKPNIVVAKDGSGQYKTISAALAAVPKKSPTRFVIYVKAGIYDEYVTVTKDMTNVFMYGDGPRKSVVTGRKSYKDGITTQNTASFNVLGNGFLCRNMGFRNTAGPEGHQAVALRVQADMVAFYNCRMDAYQDTLYTQALRQFYRNCIISGTVDFIFGDASVVIQNSLLIVRMPMKGQKNMVTAHGRKYKYETTGLVIQNCKIVPEQKLYPQRFAFPTFLGRPWKEYSRTVVMESQLGDFIQPEGWMPWAGDFALNTLEYREFNNRGPGANTNRRVNWRGYKVIRDRREAARYTPGLFLDAKTWLPATGGPFVLGLRH